MMGPETPPAIPAKLCVSVFCLRTKVKLLGTPCDQSWISCFWSANEENSLGATDNVKIERGGSQRAHWAARIPAQMQGLALLGHSAPAMAFTLQRGMLVTREGQRKRVPHGWPRCWSTDSLV